VKNAKQIRSLIWIYFILLIWEGALRKWVLPGYSNILLIARDPIVIMIYLLAVRRFPWGSGLVMFNFVLGLVGLLCSVLGTMFDPVVALYGFRVNFLHLPLIFVIPTYMNRAHVVHMGNWCMIFSIPILWMMVKQFDSNIVSSWNVGVGGSIGGQLSATVGDKARASGPFSFVSGPILFFPMVAAFVLSAFTHTKQSNKALAVIAGAACILAIPVAISRSLLMGMVITAGAYVAAIFVIPRLFPYAIRTGVAIVFLGSLVASTRLFTESSGYFGQRWASASTGGEGFSVNVIDRLVGEMTIPSQYFTQLPLFGLGLGVGTSAGSRLLTGSISYLAPEGELGRIMYEMGPVLGLFFIVLRVAVGVLILRRSLKRLRAGDVLPVLLCSACFLNVTTGQWGPPTSLGFAVLTGGLVLAACRPAVAQTRVKSAPTQSEVGYEPALAGRE
jgi:hypothetical protein